jgi:hypothetical protein
MTTTCVINLYGQSFNFDSLSNYHPLHIGDTWEYSTTEVYGGLAPVYGTFISKIIRDTIINSHKYFVIEQTQDIYYPNIKYYRLDSITANYYEYNFTLNKDILIDSTLANIVGSYTWGTLVEIKQVNVVGLNSNSRYVQTYGANSTTFSARFAYNLGLWHFGFSQFRSWKSYLLNHARINNLDYPLSNNVQYDSQDEPRYFNLSQNYPNPFNPSTIIDFKISHSNWVTLKVFDILGREIKILVNEFKEAGNYSIHFNAEILKSGMYFCRLQYGTHIKSIKMQLIK